MDLTILEAEISGWLLDCFFYTILHLSGSKISTLISIIAAGPAYPAQISNLSRRQADFLRTFLTALPHPAIHLKILWHNQPVMILLFLSSTY